MEYFWGSITTLAAVAMGGWISYKVQSSMQKREERIQKHTFLLEKLEVTFETLAEIRQHYLVATSDVYRKLTALIPVEQDKIDDKVTKVIPNDKIWMLIHCYFPHLKTEFSSYENARVAWDKQLVDIVIDDVVDSQASAMKISDCYKDLEKNIEVLMECLGEKSQAMIT